MKGFTCWGSLEGVLAGQKSWLLLVAPGVKPQEVGSMSLHRLLHTGGHKGDRGLLHTFSVHRQPGHQVRNELPLYSPCPWGFAVLVFLFLSKHEE